MKTANRVKRLLKPPKHLQIGRQKCSVYGLTWSPHLMVITCPNPTCIHLSHPHVTNTEQKLEVVDPRKQIAKLFDHQISQKLTS